MVLKSEIGDDSGDREFVLVRWLKADGERVIVDEPIAEVETDKATVDVAAWAEGILRHIAKEGDRLNLDMIEDGFARIETAQA
jgi:2-oxoglutarate dehydrogenase E2 component (dihydrolipoamide succinyltransferase)